MAKEKTGWTQAQTAGIRDRSGSLVVSASAGTGKTTVLTERCVDLVAGKDPIDIDRLLVVTFTEAASQEMRDRIRKALGKLYEDRPTSRLARQMMLLDAASISTLHSFCLQVVRENFSTAGVEPDAGVLDDDEAQMLKDDVLGRLFEGLYAGKGQGVAALAATSAPADGGTALVRGDGAASTGPWHPDSGVVPAALFVRFVAHYGQGYDDGIRGQIKHMHEYLRSLPPPQRGRWKQRALAQYELGPGGTLTAEQFAALQVAIVDEIDLLLEMSRVHLDAFQAKVGEHPGFGSGQAVHEHVTQLRAEIEKVTTGPGLRAWIERAGNLPWKRISRWGDVPEECKGWATWLKDNWKKRFVDRWLASAESWAHGIRITAEYAGLLLWLVERFDEMYGQEKRRVGKIDYSDMEEHAFSLLAGPDGQPSDIARAYQQRYDVVLVDEFQDTNPIQAAIVHMVSRESADPPQANLFVVGDVKQSIYGFRMTDPRVFAERQGKIARGEVAGKCIHLQENFRSRPEVLEFVNAVFAKLMRQAQTDVEYDAAAALKVGRTDFPEAGGPVVELHVLEGGRAAAEEERGRGGEEEQQQGEEGTEDSGESLRDKEKEAYLIASRIRELCGKPYLDRDGKVGALSYRNMVILLRSTQTSAEVFANALREHGIPVYAQLRSGYFASREIKDMLSLLQVLENMQQDIPLAAVLRSPLLGEALCDADLADIRLARPDLEFHQAVRSYAEAGPDANLRSKVARRIGTLDLWRGEARVRPLAEVISAIYEETGILEYVTLLRDGAQCRANLMSLYERARQFGQFSRQGLRRFVTFITEMIRSGREASTPTAVSEAQDVVRIMSIHASKGLEFPVVFLADLGRRFNDMDFTSSVVLDREGTLGLEARDADRLVRSDTLVKLLAASRVRKQSRAEGLRVLYVAMTRARERLILVGTRPRATEWREEIGQLWGGLSGPLPGYVVRYGSCLLDWIGPAMAGAVNSRGEPTAGDRGQGTGDSQLQQRTAGNSIKDTAPAKAGTTNKDTAQAEAWTPNEDRSTPANDAGAAPGGARGPQAARLNGHNRDNDHGPATAQDHATRSVSNGGSTSAIAVEVYARDSTDAWRVEALTRPLDGKQVLAALDGANVKPSDAAALAIGRLASRYLYENLTRIPAIKPVTELKGQLDWGDDDDEGPRHAAPTDLLKVTSGHFGVPRQLRPIGTGDAARQKGTATHLFLEKVDLAGPTDRKALARQLERLVERRLLSEVEAGLIDLDSVEWFLSETQLGMTLRAHHPTVHRELSFILRLEPERLTTGSGSDDLADCGIVRGVIDVLWTTSEGIEIADFKTDAVEGAELRRRIDLYRDQLRIYALAIQRIWKRPVCRLWLAFLHPRHVEPFQAGVLR